jgi:hypothetical protein
MLDGGLFSVNNSPIAALKFSPHEIMFGYSLQSVILGVGLMVLVLLKRSTKKFTPYMLKTPLCFL